MMYWIDEKLITKEAFDMKRKKMLNKFGCEAIATFTDKTTNKIIGKNLCWKFLEESKIRGK